MKNCWNHLNPLSTWSYFSCSERVQKLSKEIILDEYTGSWNQLNNWTKNHHCTLEALDTKGRFHLINNIPIIVQLQITQIKNFISVLSLHNIILIGFHPLKCTKSTQNQLRCMTNSRHKTNATCQIKRE